MTHVLGVPIVTRNGRTLVCLVEHNSLQQTLGQLYRVNVYVSKKNDILKFLKASKYSNKVFYVYICYSSFMKGIYVYLKYKINYFYNFILKIPLASCRKSQSQETPTLKASQFNFPFSNSSCFKKFNLIEFHKNLYRWKPYWQNLLLFLFRYQLVYKSRFYVKKMVTTFKLTNFYLNE